MDNSKYKSRFKSASWYENQPPLDVGILGLGGTGSWSALFLSRLLGYDNNLYIVDFDRYEPNNLSGQFVTTKDIGKYKTEVLSAHMINFSDHYCDISNGEYKKDSLASDIIFCCFDNMKARKIAFDIWKQHLLTGSGEYLKVFIDQRLEAEHFQIFTVLPKDIDKYEKYLFKDSEVPDVDCTLKQTTHVAAMCASKAVAIFTNVLSNYIAQFDIRTIPFFYELNIPNFNETIRSH